MRINIVSILTLTVSVSVMSTAAQAQDERLRVSFGSAVTAGSIDSELALAGSVGYRFLDRILFELEVTSTESEDDRFPGGGYRLANIPQVIRVGSGFTFGSGPPGQPTPVPLLPIALPPPDFSVFRAETEGHTLIALMGFRYELPTRGGRLRPYINGGFGVTRIEQEFSFGISPALLRPLGLSAIPEIEESRTGLATGAGVGASIRVWKELSVDIDARYFRLDRDQHLGRFGGGVSYRF